MDVEASAKPTMVIDYDVDAGPVVFKRNGHSGISKQNQLNSEVKKPISQMQDGHSRRQISRGHPLNGVNSGSHKGKWLQSSKASLAKSPLASPKASSIKVSSVKPSSSVKPPSSVKSPVINLKTSTSSGGQSKFTSEQKNSVNQPTKSAVVKEEKNSDSEDEKPLSDRIKGNSNHSSKGLGKSSTGSTLPFVSKNIVKPSPDSDDEPLSIRFPAKSNAATSGSKNYDYDDKKPLSSINQLNGSTKKPLAVPTKKPLDKENSSSQSSVKKPKLSDSPALMKNKQVSTKVEPKVDDDDHIPISQRIKKPHKIQNIPSLQRCFLSLVMGRKKWTTLVHNGVIFPPAYKPHGVKMLYNGKPVDLTLEQEEQTFRHNFWTDWRKLLGKNHVIQNLDTCDFTPIYDWYQNEKEQKKQMSTDEKKTLKEDKSKQEEKYMWAVVDDVKENVSNFRVEPPGLFRGHEEHSKSGKLKRRIRPSDVTINIGKDAPLPKCPIPGERWREIRHDNIVTWLAFWNDPINPREFKYVFLAASSSLRGKDYIAKIRQAYERDFTSSDVLTSLANFRKLYKCHKVNSALVWDCCVFKRSCLVNYTLKVLCAPISYKQPKKIYFSNLCLNSYLLNKLILTARRYEPRESKPSLYKDFYSFLLSNPPSSLQFSYQVLLSRLIQQAKQKQKKERNIERKEEGGVKEEVSRTKKKEESSPTSLLMLSVITSKMSSFAGSVAKIFLG
ncbi:hypothetical protein UlMin_015896 [Ulmus minor]